METVSAFKSMKCNTLIFGLITGNIQTTDSVLADIDTSDRIFMLPKKKKKRDKTWPQPLHIG